MAWTAVARFLLSSAEDLKNVDSFDGSDGSFTSVIFAQI